MKFKSLLFSCIISLVVCFGVLIFFFQRNAYDKEISRINSHAKVIASSLWTFERSSPTAYLTLAVEANGYDNITVRDDNGGEFLMINGTGPGRLESLLRSVHLVPVLRLEAAVVYEGRTIGKIIADWPCRTIVTYAYILLCMVLLLTGIGLFLKLLDAKRFLEDRVARRTAELEREVLERKRTEEELRSYTQRLSMHVMHTPLGVIEWDLDFRVVEWNKSAERIFEYTRDEALGRDAYDLLIPANEAEYVRQVWEHLLSRTGGIRSVNTNRTKTGEIRVCQWYNTILTRPDGSIVGVASLVLDITEQKQAEKEKLRLEAQLLQAQKMEAVGELAGGIAHDFNNLLQGISGYTQLLLIECAQKKEDCSRLQGIQRAALRAADLIRQLLTFSRKIESQLRPLNLNHAIDRMKEMLERTIPKMIAFEYYLTPELNDIEGDAMQIEQVIMNLSINAMHAMPEGGKVIIETSNELLDEAYCRSHFDSKAGRYVVLSVSDNGTGMDPETLHRIYEPFFTTKEIGQGTGLGLSIVYGIVKSHGAHIKCYSEPGKGTRFQIYFPAAATETVVEDQMPVSDDIPQGTETVLLVDDDEAVRDIGLQMLSNKGYAVMTATSGEEGVRLYRDRSQSIDLVVLDLNMPGMGGYKCMQALRAIDPGIKILIASGYTPKGEIQHTLAEGAQGYIIKPFQFVDFMKKVRHALDSA